MKFTNNMGNLVNKISHRLGVEMLMNKLPKNIDKYKWVELIQTEVLDLYSRHYPHVITYKCIPSRDFNHITEQYIIDDKYIDSNMVKILGVKGLKQSEVKNALLPSNLIYDPYHFITGDVISSAVDITSALTMGSYFPENLFIEFYPPNGFKITNVAYCDLIQARSEINIELLINHPKSLSSISQTAMGLFEDLCTCKVAELIYGHLKYFDGIETGYQTIDLKLDTVQDWMNKIDDVLNIIRESYISMANKNQDLFYII